MDAKAAQLIDYAPSVPVTEKEKRLTDGEPF